MTDLNIMAKMELDVRNARLLLVEDESIVALDVADQLASLGYQVTAIAASGEEAVEKATELRPQLVLMDIMLKGEMDGVAASAQILETLDIPVVFLSALSDADTLDRAKRTGPFGYLLKPFDERELHVAIECAIWRHEMEREAAAKKARFEEQLRETQKMEAVGQLIAGVAHNFNNALAVVLGNIELMQLATPDDGNLGDARAAASRAAEMVKQLLLFTRHTSYKHEVMDIRSLVHNVAAMCRGTFDRKIAINFEAGDGVVAVAGDVAQLRQTILNLSLNARDSLGDVQNSDGSPRIDFKVEPLHFVTEDQLRHPLAEVGDYVRISVADNGSGMEEVVQRRIFEPFFSTKEVGKGTGLGLSSVYAIVHEHLGWVECSSSWGKGSTFSVYLPALDPDTVDVEELAKDPLQVPGEEYPSGRGETVLVIEDEELVQNTLRTMLTEFSYSVVMAGDGEEGVAAYKQHRQDVDLVILDLSLPQVSGSEVLKELRRIEPDVKVLIATGVATEDVDLEGARQVIAKPFQVGDLVRSIREILDSD